jgi:hypothetical protein
LHACRSTLEDPPPVSKGNNDINFEAVSAGQKDLAFTKNRILKFFGRDCLRARNHLLPGRIFLKVTTGNTNDDPAS